MLKRTTTITSTPKIIHAHDIMPIQLVRLFAAVLPASELVKSSSGILPTLGRETEDGSCCETSSELADDTALETAEDDCLTETFFTYFFVFEEALYEDALLEDKCGLLDGAGVFTALLLETVSGADVAAGLGSDEVCGTESCAAGSVSP